MIGRVRHRAAWSAALAAAGLTALAAWLAGGCAPRLALPPGAEREALERRFEAARLRREGMLAAADADLIVRVEGRATGRLPGFTVRAALASPDRLRLRASWLLGTALDLCARADTLTALVPSRRLGVVLAGIGDSLHVREPVRIACQALGATWAPTREAWARSRPDGDARVLDWLDEGDSLSLRIERDGHPREIRVARAGGAAVRVHYDLWRPLGGTDWPGRFTISDEAGAVRIACEVADARFRAGPDPGWFALALPDRTERLDWPGLRRLLRRGGAP